MFNANDIQQGLMNGIFNAHKTVYLVIEHGWYYSVLKQIFLTKEEALDAISCTEIQLEEARKKDYTKERGYYYTDIEEIDVNELLKNFVSDIETQTIQKEARNIQKKAEENIKTEVNHRIRQEMNKRTKEIYTKIEQIFSNEYNITTKW